MMENVCVWLQMMKREMDDWKQTTLNVMLQKEVLFFLCSARNGFLGVYGLKLGGCISQKLKN